MQAWSADTMAPKAIHNYTPLEREGAVVFQDKQCRNCHEIDGMGGQRGPALDEVAVDMTPDQLIRQVLQGGGNMPAYGKNLSPPEVDALVAFLETLHKPTQIPAADASQTIMKLETKIPVSSFAPPPGQGASVLHPMK